MIIFTDSDNRRWKVWVRAWYLDKIKNATQLKRFKQKAADERRAKGYDKWADEIEKQTIIRWSIDSGIFSKKVRIK